MSSYTHLCILLFPDSPLSSRYLVFHGGSGSTEQEINTAVNNGVVKMNVDTDTQFSYLVGMRVCGPFFQAPVGQCYLGIVLTVVSNSGLLREEEGLLAGPGWQS